MQNILELTTTFHLDSEQVIRFETNIYVQGDNIAEHLARGCRLITYLAQLLKKEFPQETDLIEHLFSIFIIHDDDEVLVGKDIVTSEKALKLLSLDLDNVELDNVGKALEDYVT